MLSVTIANRIREGYTGGAVDIFLKLLKRNLIYAYDINALYPYLMKNFVSPIGYPIFFYR
jgi:hypothetical protein